MSTKRKRVSSSPARLDRKFECCMCDNAAKHLCHACSSAQYCSDECQEADWSLHKQFCPDLSSFDERHRPRDSGSRYVRAVMFPWSSPQPSFMWLKLSDTEDCPSEKEISGLLDSQDVRRHTFDENVIQEKKVPEVTLFTPRQSPPVWSRFNESISTATGCQDHPWHGSAIAVRYRGPFGRRGFPQEEQIDDMVYSDFRNAVDQLRAPYCDEMMRDIRSHFLSKRYRAVRINCVGDRVRCGRPTFEVVTVPACHPIFQRFSTPDVANLLDFMLHTWRCRPHHTWKDLPGGPSPYSNPEADVFLASLTDFNRSNPLKLLGSILVFLPWSPEDAGKHRFTALELVESLCGWSREVVIPALLEKKPYETINTNWILNKVANAGKRHLPTDTLKKMAKEDFELYTYEYIHNKKRAGDGGREASTLKKRSLSF